MKRILWGVLFMALLFGALLVGPPILFYFIPIFIDGKSLLSEDAVFNHWLSNKEEYKLLLDFAKKSPQVGRFNKEILGTSIDQKMQADFQIKMNKLNVSGPIYLAKDPFLLRIYVTSTGLSISGTAMGIVYSDAVPGTIVTGPFEEFHKHSVSSIAEAYKPLGDNWYLFYEYVK